MFFLDCFFFTLVYHSGKPPITTVVNQKRAPTFALSGVRIQTKHAKCDPEDGRVREGPQAQRDSLGAQTALGDIPSIRAKLWRRARIMLAAAPLQPSDRLPSARVHSGVFCEAQR